MTKLPRLIGGQKMARLRASRLVRIARRIPARWVRVATVVFIALATGHIMQHGNALAARMDAERAAASQLHSANLPPAIGQPGAARDPVVAPLVEIALAAPPGVPRLGHVEPVKGPVEPNVRVLVPGPMPLPPQRRDTALGDVLTAPDLPAEAPALADACATELSLAPAAAAMIALDYRAPCAPGAEVAIEQIGLRFNTFADADGRVALEVPALSTSAEITVRSGGRETAASIAMPTLADYDRVAVAWSGLPGPQLNAFEFGAGYGDEGHVWRDNPRDAGWALAAKGGFVRSYGDSGALAPAWLEVYTFPAGRYEGKGAVDFSLDAEVMAANCGKEISAESVMIQGGATPAPADVSVIMPECDAVGDYLVFADLFPELRLAGRD